MLDAANQWAAQYGYLFVVVFLMVEAAGVPIPIVPSAEKYQVPSRSMAIRLKRAKFVSFRSTVPRVQPPVGKSKMDNSILVTKMGPP